MANPLDILYGRAPAREGDDFSSSLATLASAIASIPERRRQAAERRAQLEAETMNAQTRAGNLQLQQQEMQQRQTMQQKAAQLDQAVNQIVKEAFITDRDGTKRIDRNRMQEGLARIGAPLDMQAKAFKSVDDLEESGKKLKQEMNEHKARVLNAVLESPDVTQGALLAISDGVANGWLSEDDKQQVYALLASGQDPRPAFKQMRDSLSDKYREKPKDTEGIVVPAGGTLVEKGTGKELFKAPAKLPDVNIGSFEDYAIRYAAAKGKKPEELTPADIEDARKRYQQADDRPRVTVRTGNEVDLDGLTKAVINNPALWDDLTPTVKGQLAPRLEKEGYTNFGKPMSPGALKQVQESMTSLDALRDLRKTLQDNEQYIGPIAGYQALNPYSDARKAQAKIDLVRQRVGKALEGGVLRKEDEAKYKIILAQLTDEPSTAISKVDNLLKSIEQDVANFKAAQRLGGRRVLEDKTEPPKRIKVTFDKDGNLVRQ